MGARGTRPEVVSGGPGGAVPFCLDLSNVKPSIIVRVAVGCGNVSCTVYPSNRERQLTTNGPICHLVFKCKRRLQHSIAVGRPADTSKPEELGRQFEEPLSKRYLFIQYAENVLSGLGKAGRLTRRTQGKDVGDAFQTITCAYPKYIERLLNGAIA